MPLNLNLDPSRPLRIVQISDCHLEQSSSAELLGLNVEQSFCDVLDHIAATELPLDLILCSGDISGDYSLDSYRRFHQLVSERLPTVPLVALPGNHDLPANMAAALPGNCLPKKVIAGNWLVYLLDSSVEGCIHGDLGRQQLQWLQRELEQNRNRPSLICCHHQPVAVNSAWIDDYIIRSADEFLIIADAEPQIKAVAWGHVHQEFSAQRQHYQLLAAPSTCIQFAPAEDDFQLHRAMPGYRLFELGPAGELQSQVKRIAERDYPIDYNSGGY